MLYQWGTQTVLQMVRAHRGGLVAVPLVGVVAGLVDSEAGLLVEVAQAGNGRSFGRGGVSGIL